METLKKTVLLVVILFCNAHLFAQNIKAPESTGTCNFLDSYVVNKIKCKSCQNSSSMCTGRIICRGSKSEDFQLVGYNNNSDVLPPAPIIKKFPTEFSTLAICRDANCDSAINCLMEPKESFEEKFTLEGKRVFGPQIKSFGNGFGSSQQ